MSILEGRVAVVTGASSGIGEACARSFVEKGAKVVLAARRAERLSALVEKLEAMGGEALPVTTDVTDEAAVDNLFAQAVERFGSVDVLINNAGIADSTPVDEMPLDLWERVLTTNLTSAFLCSRAAFRVMKGKGRGRTSFERGSRKRRNAMDCRRLSFRSGAICSSLRRAIS